MDPTSAATARSPRALRRDGVPAVYGDATRPLVLEHANVAKARLLIVNTPDPYHARHIVATSKRVCADLVTVVRTHSDPEMEFLKEQDVGRVVMGERELAYGMAHFALITMGSTDDEADRAVIALRAEGKRTAGGRGRASPVATRPPRSDPLRPLTPARHRAALGPRRARGE